MLSTCCVVTSSGWHGRRHIPNILRKQRKPKNLSRNDAIEVGLLLLFSVININSTTSGIVSVWNTVWLLIALVFLPKATYMYLSSVWPICGIDASQHSSKQLCELRHLEIGVFRVEVNGLQLPLRGEDWGRNKFRSPYSSDFLLRFDKKWKLFSSPWWAVSFDVKNKIKTKRYCQMCQITYVRCHCCEKDRAMCGSAK